MEIRAAHVCVAICELTCMETRNLQHPQSLFVSFACKPPMLHFELVNYDAKPQPTRHATGILVQYDNAHQFAVQKLFEECIKCDARGLRI